MLVCPIQQPGDKSSQNILAVFLVPRDPRFLDLRTPKMEIIAISSVKHSLIRSEKELKPGKGNLSFISHLLLRNEMCIFHKDERYIKSWTKGIVLNLVRWMLAIASYSKSLCSGCCQGLPWVKQCLCSKRLSWGEGEGEGEREGEGKGRRERGFLCIFFLPLHSVWFSCSFLLHPEWGRHSVVAKSLPDAWLRIATYYKESVVCSQTFATLWLLSSNLRHLFSSTLSTP